MVWPYWPKQFRTSSSQEEGCERDFGIMTKRIEGKRGKVEKLIACRVEQTGGKYVEIPGSEFEIPADMVILAMGFAGPAAPVLEAFGVEKDNAGNALAALDGEDRFKTSVAKVVCGGRCTPRPVAGGLGLARRQGMRRCRRSFSDGGRALTI